MVVIGEGPHRAQLMQEMLEKDLDASVDFVGGVSESQKNKLLKQSRVGLSLSFEEGWGLSVTEFLAAGLPVVAYELPVFRELFNEIIQFVPTGVPAKAAERIIEILHDKKLSHEMGEKGWHHARQYQYETVAKQEMNLMQQLFS